MKFSNNGIGIQDFEKIRENNTFYVDKTHFISEWWKGGSAVTIITRPRRFGKTLNMSMLECFFSNKYEGRSELFEGLFIGEDKDMMALQGTFPVIAISFANIKPTSYGDFKQRFFGLIKNLYEVHSEIEKPDSLQAINKAELLATQNNEKIEISDSALISKISELSQKLYEHYGKKVIIILDEYDTPMIEAFVHGYWDEMAEFMRALFNYTFKTNRALQRAIMTGITRVSRESMFSDFNNAEVVTITSEEYATAFGFTEAEVFEALDDQGLSDQKAEVKRWYDGFRIGNVGEIYNPWSIVCFLNKKQYNLFWTNTSSNDLAVELIQHGDSDIKNAMEDMLNGVPLVTELDEQLIFPELYDDENAIWSLLLASGYLRADSCVNMGNGRKQYTLSLTNYEVKCMFENRILKWFKGKTGIKKLYNEFVKSLLADDKELMNQYMNDITLEIFSSFDVGNRPSGKSEPERFYHGFVLGLLVDLRGEYNIHSNRESGFGRYDIMLEPLKEELPGIVIEFKVLNARKESTLEDTVKAALTQIEEKNYVRELLDKGVSEDRIFSYGFAFEGKNVLIG